MDTDRLLRRLTVWIRKEHNSREDVHEAPRSVLRLSVKGLTGSAV